MTTNTNKTSHGGDGYGSIIRDENGNAAVSYDDEEGKHQSSSETSQYRSSPLDDANQTTNNQRLDLNLVLSSFQRQIQQQQQQQQQSWSSSKQPVSYQDDPRGVYSSSSSQLPWSSPTFYYQPINQSQRHRRQRTILLRVLLGVFLVGGMVCFVWMNHAAASPKRSSSGTRENDSEDSYNNVPVVKHPDYIVVGGGPSGILAATQLAQKLPHATILLMESGTVSQSNVLSNLQQQKQQQQQSRSSQAVDMDVSGQTQYHSTLSSSTSSSSLNKYDIPLMWSGIATTQRRVQETFGLEPDPKAATYWPIPLALLARGLGGCGLHNAMIYVRSLPTCFERWNLPNWTFDHMLPVYKRLEHFVPRNDNNKILPINATRQQPPNDNYLGTDEDDAAWLKEFRGQDGPIRTVHAGPTSDVMGDYFVQAAVASGVPLAGGGGGGGTNSKVVGGSGKTGGFNHIHPNDRIGVGYYEFNVKNGVRDSVVHAMLGRKLNQRSMTAEGAAAEEEEGNNNGIPSNLVVQTGRTVTKVLWSKTGSREEEPRAMGVTYIDNESGKQGNLLLRSDVDANQKLPQTEVILATGAIMTPQILWNSGVGEGGSVVDLPGVGKNLQDHPVLGMAYEITTEMTQNAPQMFAVADEMEDYTLAVKVLNDLEKEEEDLDKMAGRDTGSHKQDKERVRQKRAWVSKRLGDFGTSGFAVGAFLRSPYAAEGEKGPEIPPDIQITVFPRVIEPHQPRSKSKVDVSFMRSRAMLVTVALLQPEARYEVKPSTYAGSADKEKRRGDGGDPIETLERRDKQSPFSSVSKTGDKIAASFAEAMQYPLPSIELPSGKTEYLTDRDIKRLAWGMEEVRRILRSPPLSNVTTTELYPGSSVVAGETLNKYIRANHLANSHWVGTTKMGRDDDPMAVLDERLRVRGVQGLRVVDSGAIPFVPNGNTHSTICAVSSRGVDFIVADRDY